jgi:hypothetical protein
MFSVVALHGAPAAWEELRRREPVVQAGPKNPLLRVAATKHLQHVLDARMEEAYVDREFAFVPLVELAGARTLLMVPMLRKNELIGPW